MNVTHAMKEIPLPVVFISSKALSKLQGYISLVDGEISGFGEVEKYGERNFLINDLFLFGQKNDDVSTDLDMDQITDFMSKAMDEGRDLSKLKLWWHSHGNFAPIWSHDDDDAISHLHNSGWMLSVVGSKKHGYEVRLDVFKPVKLTLYGLRFMHLDTHDGVPIESLKDEVTRLVTVIPDISEKPVQTGGKNVTTD
jgi:hypothetical protein